MPRYINEATKKKVFDLIKKHQRIGITDLIRESVVSKEYLEKILDELQQQGKVIILKFQETIKINDKEKVINHSHEILIKNYNELASKQSKRTKKRKRKPTRKSRQNNKNNSLTAKRK